MKKLLCGVLTLLMLAGLGGCSKRFSGGEDTPYPYEWTEKGNGTIVFSVNGAEAPEHDWLPQDYDSAMLSVSEQKVKGDYHTYTLTPQMSGLTEITFACEKQEGPLTEHSYEIHLILSIDEKNKASVTEHYQTACSTLQRRGEDTAVPYVYQTEKDGTLSLFIENDSEEAIWCADSSDETVAVPLRQEDAEGGVWYVVQPVGRGEATMTFTDSVSGLKVTLPVTVDENNNVLADGTTAPTDTGRADSGDAQTDTEDAA